MANLLNGFDLNTTDEAELEKTKQTLIGQKPLLRGYSADTITNMSSGNAWIEHIWNGDVVNMRNQVDAPENYRFEKCKEGIPVGTRHLRDPRQRAHPGTAMLFIDCILDPEHAAKNIEYFGYPMPNDGGARGVRRARQGRAGDQRHGRGPREGRAVRQPARRGTLWNETWTEVKAA